MCIVLLHVGTFNEYPRDNEWNCVSPAFVAVGIMFPLYSLDWIRMVWLCYSVSLKLTLYNTQGQDMRYK